LPFATTVDRGFAFIAFTTLLFANIALVPVWVGGFPVRGILAVGLLMFLLLLYPDQARLALKRNMLLLGFAAALGTAGIFVSIVNGASMQAITKGITEVHLQAAVTIMVTAILAQLCGPRACVFAIVGIVGVSGGIAVLQMLDVEAAWTLRRSLGPLDDEVLDGLNLAERRPVGISFTPIQFSTHLCLAFAAYGAVRHRLRKQNLGNPGADPLIPIALLAFVVACIASATRSPILGAVIFLAAYLLYQRASWLWLFLIFGGVVLYFAWPLLMGLIESSNPRLSRTDDNSALSRQTMMYYGMRLFLDNPFGYGFAFKPSELWASYWQELYTLPAPHGVRVTLLHNYVLTMLNIYGISLLLVAPIIAKLLVRSSQVLIFFIPYLAHIFFHNSGPFYNDTVLWFVVAAIASTTSVQTFATQQPRANRPMAAAPGRSLRPAASGGPRGGSGAVARGLISR
jgi:hypothetical protein